MGGAAAGRGRRRPLGFGLPGSGAAPWPPAIEEEGAGGGGGPAVAAVRPAEGEATRERRRPDGAGQLVGGGRQRGREKAAAVVDGQHAGEIG